MHKSTESKSQNRSVDFPVFSDARLLVVEDNPANMELMCYLLAAAGYRTERAASGQQALESLRHALPDLVICDVQMPDLDGVSLLAQARSMAGARAVPMIAVTALAMHGDREKLLGAGFDGYLSKPIEPRQFAQQIASWLPLQKRAQPRPAIDHRDRAGPAQHDGSGASPCTDGS